MSLKKVLIIAAGCLMIVPLAVLVHTGEPSKEPYMVMAEFENAAQLRQNASVKIAGVRAGKVKEMVITDDDNAIAKMELEEFAVPIGEGASVLITPTDLLGERYAALNPGDLSKPAKSGTMIPLERTKAPVELDEIFNMFNPDTRTRTQILIHEMGIGLSGRGADFNQLLGQLPGSLDKAEALVGEIADENEALRRLISDGDAVVAAANSRRGSLGRLIEEGDLALTTVDERRKELGDTIENAPGTINALRTTLDEVGAASASIGPAADSLRRTAGPLRSALVTLPQFARTAQNALRVAVKASPSIERLSRGATGPLRTLRPTAELVDDVTHEARPIVASIDRRVMRDALWFIQNWEIGMRGRDSLGHFIGAKLHVSEHTLQTIVDSIADGKATPADANKNKGAKRSDKKARPSSSSAGKKLRKKLDDQLRGNRKKLPDAGGRSGRKSPVRTPRARLPLRAPRVRLPRGQRRLPKTGDSRRLLDHLLAP